MRDILYSNIGRQVWRKILERFQISNWANRVEASQRWLSLIRNDLPVTHRVLVAFLITVANSRQKQRKGEVLSQLHRIQSVLGGHGRVVLCRRVWRGF